MISIFHKLYYEILIINKHIFLSIIYLFIFFFRIIIINLVLYRNKLLSLNGDWGKGDGGGGIWDGA